MKRYVYFLPALFTILLSLLLAAPARATHLLGGEIHWQQTSKTVLQVYVVIYTDRSGVAAPTSVPLQIRNLSITASCNVQNVVTLNRVAGPTISRSLGCTQLTNLPNYGAERSVFSGTVNLPSATNRYLLSVNVNARPSLANINVVATNNLLLTATIDNSIPGLNDTFSGDPQTLINGPIEFELLSIGCLAEINTLRQPVTDTEGDSLAYEMVPSYTNTTANQSGDCFVEAIYSPIVARPAGATGSSNYSPTFPIHSYVPRPGSPGINDPFFTINERTGIVQFRPTRFVQITQPDDPSNKYVFVVRVKEYRRVNGVPVLITTRDRNMIVFVEFCGNGNNSAPTSTVLQSQDFQNDSLLVLGPDSSFFGRPSVCSFPTYLTVFTDPDTVDFVSIEPIVNRYFRVQAIKQADSITLAVRFIPRPDSLYKLAKRREELTFVLSVRDRGCPFNRTQSVRFRFAPYIKPGPLRQTAQTVCSRSTITSRVVYEDSIIWELPNGAVVRRRGPDLPDVTLSGQYRSRSTQDVCFHEDTLNLTVLPVLPSAGWPRTYAVCRRDTVLAVSRVPGAQYSWVTPTGPAGDTVRYLAVTAGRYILNSVLGTCRRSDTVTLTVGSGATPNLGIDRVFCSGSILTANVGSVAVNWTLPSGATTVANTILATTSGRYIARVILGRCSTSDTVVLDVIPSIPPANFPRNRIVCGTDTVLSVPSLPGVVYQWLLPTGTTTGASIVANRNGRYILNRVLNSCIRRDTIFLTFLGNTRPNLGVDRYVCSGTTITADGSGQPAIWRLPGGATVTSPDVVVTTSGRYIATFTNGNCSASDTAELTVLTQLPSQNFTRQLSICRADTVLRATALTGVDYSWITPGPSVFGPNITASISGLYVLVSRLGSCIRRDSIQLTLVRPNSVILGVDRALCGNTTITSGSLGLAVQWQLPDGTTTVAPSVTANLSGRYIATLRGNNCVVSDTVTIAVFTALPSPGLPRTATVCRTDTVLRVTPVQNIIYSWITPGNIFNGASVTAFTSGRYILVSRVGSCERRDTVQLNLLSLPVPNLGADRNSCAGANLSVGVSGPPATWTLPDGSTIFDRIITVNTSGRYIATVSNGTCSLADTVNLTVLTQLPSANFPRNLAVCRNDTVLSVVPAPGLNYTWTAPGPGAVGPTITARISGIYILTSRLDGCTRRDTINLTLLNVNQPNLGADRTTCSTTVLDPGLAGQLVQWTLPDGTSLTAPRVTATQSGKYVVRISGTTCTYVDSVTLNVIATLPSPNLPRRITACRADTTLFISTFPGATYTWQTPGLSGSGASIRASLSGLYILQTSVDNCARLDSIDIDLVPNANFNLGPDRSVCGNFTLATGGPVGTRARWTLPNGTTVLAASVPVTQSGRYIASSPSAVCFFADTVNITLIQTLPPAGLPSSLFSCRDTTLSVVPLPGVTYSWQTPTGTVAGPSVLANRSGVYTLRTTQNSCTRTDAVNVTIDNTTIPTLGPDRVVCSGTFLQSNFSGNSVFWTLPDGTTSTNVSIPVTMTGRYTVRTDVGGCIYFDTLLVLGIFPEPTGLRTVSRGCSALPYLELTRRAQHTYRWTTPTGQVYIDSSRILNTVPGTYQLRIQAGACVRFETIVVGQLQVSVTGPGNRQYCQNDPRPTLRASAIAADSVVWLLPNGTRVRDSVRNPLSDGLYIVTAYGANCNATDSVTISSFPQPLPQPLPRRLTTCDTTLTLRAVKETGVIYRIGRLGGVAVAPDSLLVRSSGFYVINALRGTCTRTDTFEVVVSLPLALSLGPDRTVCPRTPLVPTLVANTGRPVQWQLPNGTSASGPSIPTVGPGLYIATITSGPCSLSDSIVIGFLPEAPRQTLPRRIQTCDSAQQLTGARSPGVSYSVRLPGGQVVNDTVRWLATVSGAYIFEGRLGTCSVFDTVDVVLSPLRKPRLEDSVVICQSTTLTPGIALPVGTVAEWQTPQGVRTGPTLVATRGGQYILTLSLQGCTQSDTIWIRQEILTAQTLPRTLAVCGNTTTLTRPTQAGVNFTWQLPGGQTVPDSLRLRVTASGDYILTSAGVSCVRRDTVSVTFNPIPVFTLPDTLRACIRESYTVPGSLVGVTVTWQKPNGQVVNSPQVTLDVEGKYIATTNTGICSYTDSTVVRFKAFPAPFAYTRVEQCAASFNLPLTAPAGTRYIVQRPNGTSDTTTTQFTGAVSGLYQVRTQGPECERTDTVFVELNSQPSPQLGYVFQVCDSARLTVQVPILPNTVVGWQTPQGQVVGGNTLLALASGRYYVTLTTTVGALACVQRDSIDVVIYPSIVASGLPRALNTCDAPISVDPGALDPTVTYTWELPDGRIEPVNGPLVATAGGNYLLRMTRGTCTRIDTATVIWTVIEPVPFGTAREVCEPVLLTPVLQAGAIYRWQTPQGEEFAATVATPTPGIYKLTTLLNGCSRTDSILITFREPEEIELLAQAGQTTLSGTDVLVAFPFEFQVTPSVPGTNGEFTINGAKQTGERATIKAAGPQTISISFTGKNENGCPVRGSRILSIQPLQVPTVFTPNGDGKNDRWEIEAIANGYKARLQVSNRWGQTVLETDDYRNTWDGGDLPSGTYFYLLEVKDLGQFRGWVEILK